VDATNTPQRKDPTMLTAFLLFGTTGLVLRGIAGLIGLVAAAGRNVAELRAADRYIASIQK
jgi:hypothetical protein